VSRPKQAATSGVLAACAVRLLSPYISGYMMGSSDVWKVPPRAGALRTS